MNSTNRVLNRTFSFVIGLILFAFGLGAIAVATIPYIRDGWRMAAPDIVDTISGWFTAAVIPGLEHSWWYVAIVAGLLLLVVLLVVFIFRQGRGHTGVLFVDASEGSGQVTVESKVAEQVLKAALDEHPGLLSSRVSTYDVNGTAVLKISTTARRGVSPKHIVDEVEKNLDALGAMLGRDVPAAIQVGGGFRAATGKATRLG